MPSDYVLVYIIMYDYLAVVDTKDDSCSPTTTTVPYRMISHALVAEVVASLEALRARVQTAQASLVVVTKRDAAEALVVVAALGALGAGVAVAVTSPGL